MNLSFFKRIFIMKKSTYSNFITSKYFKNNNEDSIIKQKTNHSNKNKITFIFLLKIFQKA